MVHVLVVVPMIGNALLVTVGRIIGPIQIEDDALRDPLSLPFPQVELHQCDGQVVARLEVDGILQPGEGRLAGQIGLIWEAATDQL
jgi:hypothetical protein